MSASSAALNLVKRFRKRELGRAPVRELLAAADASLSPSKAHPRVPNPFLFQRDPATGRWLEPRYSRRRQAQLVKAARASGTLDLLPPGPKLHRSEIAEFRRKQEQARLTQAAQPPLVAETSQKKGGKKTAKAASKPSSKPVSRADANQKKKGSNSTSSGKKKTKAAAKPSCPQPVPRTEPHERPVRWLGRVWGRRPKGHDVGARLYARRKFMFKGHRWEKVVVLRHKFIKLRLKSQARRIRRWHATRIVNRNPFNPVRGTARLPF